MVVLILEKVIDYGEHSGKTITGFARSSQA
jgi:hypothetical protein